MRSTAIRLLNLIFCVGILLGYDLLLTFRADREEIAKLQAQLTAANQRVEEYENALSAILPQESAESAQGGGGYQDGVYEGSGIGFADTLTVAVTIQDGKIADITVVEQGAEDEPYFGTACQILQDIVEKGDTEVDTISGATFSSLGLRDAVDDALKKAVKG